MAINCYLVIKIEKNPLLFEREYALCEQFGSDIFKNVTNIFDDHHS